MHSWEGRGKSGSLGQNYGRRSARSDWLHILLHVWKLQETANWSVLWWKSSAFWKQVWSRLWRMNEKLPETMEAVFWAPVLLICAVLKATFTFVCLFMSCHLFFTSSTSLRVDACYTIQSVCYSCTNSLSMFLFGWCRITALYYLSVWWHLISMYIYFLIAKLLIPNLMSVGSAMIPFNCAHDWMILLSCRCDT